MSEPVEIERKFLVRDLGWREGAKGKRIKQGYIASATGNTNATSVRVRVRGEKGFLTIKADKDHVSRWEFEYEIPVEDAERMLDLLSLKPPIDKTRYEVVVDGLTWEVDVFEGANAGLVLAEVELTHADQPFTRPDWAGPEVTGDPRFFNAYLSEKPFGKWGVTYEGLLGSVKG